MNGWVFVATAMAGGAGAALRYVVDALVSAGRPARFPLGILLVNVTGSFALGVLTGVGAGAIDTDLAMVVGVGLLGGYTTFSTVSLEAVLAVDGGQARRGWLNAAGTLVLGVSAAGLGLALGALI
jgi:fluoride exporter